MRVIFTRMSNFVFIVFRPPTRCFSSQISNTVLFANTVIEQGITVSSISDLSSPLLYDQLVEQHRQFLAVKEAHAHLCGEMMGNELKYMGTATVVRDIDFMSRVIEGEDEKMYACSSNLLLTNTHLDMKQLLGNIVWVHSRCLPCKHVRSPDFIFP